MHTNYRDRIKFMHASLNMTINMLYMCVHVATTGRNLLHVLVVCILVLVVLQYDM